MRALGFISIFVTYGSTGEIGEYQHCTEYRDILQDYQELLTTHQTCVITNGEQRAEIRAYQNLITNGLQQQIDGVKREQSRDTQILSVLFAIVLSVSQMCIPM